MYFNPDQYRASDHDPVIVGLAVCDEIAFWKDETTANPDVEVINAIRPGLATTPGSVLLAISSPYARRGALWSAFKEHYGKDGAVLVWQADTLSMNPTIPASTVEEAYERDASVAHDFVLVPVALDREVD